MGQGPILRDGWSASKRRTSRLVLVTAVVLALVFVAGATWRARRGPPPGLLRAGLVHDPPYMYRGDDGRPRGLAVDVVAEAARRSGIQLTWTFLPNSNADQALRDGVVDVWPSLTILPSRQREFHFSAPWLRTEIFLVVRNGGPAPPASYAGRLGHGDVPVLYNLRQHFFPRSQGVPYRDAPALARALCSGEIDVGFLPTVDTLWSALDPRGDCEHARLRPHVLPGTSLSQAIASRPAHRGAADAMRQQLDGMAKDGTVARLALPHSFYVASEMLTIFELLEGRAHARLLGTGLAVLAIALIATVGVSVALYRANREKGRALAAQAALEARLLQAQKMEAIGRLAGGIAHDFNNLMTVVTGYTELALAEARNEHLAQPLAEIRRAGLRATDLVRQLLAFSRRQAVNPQVLSVNQALHDMEGMIRRLLREDVRLVLKLDANPDRVVIDPGQFEQVLLNLAVNARDAMPDGGRLEIGTSCIRRHSSSSGTGAGAPEPWVRVSVSDTGTGMDEDTRTRVFEPFFTTKATGAGTGLGLSTTYGIVTQAGGTIEVESRVGHGTRFDVWLPASDDPLPARAAVPPATAGRRAPATILVVEDQESVRQLVETVLQNAGHRVLLASDGEQGLALAHDHGDAIDLVLTDLVMPGISGRQVGAELARRGARAPVVFMSGYAGSGNDAPAPAGRLLSKPFTPAELLAVVSRALEARTG
jgi:signal transduction histidine kinase/CheY-like chemotaxis protein